jgi:FkbM family methyltransferase
MSMKTILRQLFHQAGFDIVKHYPSPLERAKALKNEGKGAQFLKLLTFYEIDLVLDVGANVGQYGQGLFELGYQGFVLSFEPLSAAYESLCLAQQRYADWDVADRCALGDRDGEIEINISENSESSSILDILPAHVDAARRSAYIGSEVVPLRRLDGLVRDRLTTCNAPFLKIDAQGYEDRVLQGASAILPQIQGLYLEMSLVPLYGDQLLFDDTLKLVKDLGFSLHYLHPGFADYRTGRLLQVMGTFFREKAA